MAQRIEAFTIVVAAGTTSSAPSDTALDFVDGNVERLEIVVPRGHAGFTGFSIRYASQQVIPKKSGQFIVTDGETINWPIEDFPTGNQWVFRAYNTDVFDHNFYLRLLVTELGGRGNPGTRIIPIG